MDRNSIIDPIGSGRTLSVRFLESQEDTCMGQTFFLVFKYSITHTLAIMASKTVSTYLIGPSAPTKNVAIKSG